MRCFIWTCNHLSAVRRLTWCPCLLQTALVLKKAVFPEMGPDVERLRLQVDASLPDILHVKLTDAEGKRWQVPHALLASSAARIPGEQCWDGQCSQILRHVLMLHA